MPVAATAAMASLLLFSPPAANAEVTPPLTPAQQQEVYAALIADGVPETSATQIAANPDLAAGVPTNEEEFTLLEDPVVTPNKIVDWPDGGTVSTRKVGGSSCKYYRSGTATKVLKNYLRQMIVSTYIETNWCYNGSVVQQATSTRGQTVGRAGSLAGLQFQGWNDAFPSTFYTYNGHVNGGVKTTSEGYWKQCYAVCFGAKTIGVRLYAHYDGTAYTSAYGS